MSARPHPEPPLRVGLLLPGTTVPAWVRRVISGIRDGGVATLALAVVDAEPPGRGQNRWRRLLAHHRTLLYRLYARLDRALFPVEPDPFERLDVTDLLAGVPRMAVTPFREGYSDRFPEEALTAIRRHELDVLLRFGFRILRGGILEAARYGVWSYHHDDPQVIRGGPPGFWEVLEGHPVTGSVLQVLNERLDAGRVIYRSWAPTDRRSVHRSKAHVYWKSAAFVGRKLEDLARHGATGLDREEPFAPYDGPLYRNPTNLRMARLLPGFLRRAGGDWAADRLGRKQWFPAFRLHRAGEGEDGPAEELYRATPMMPPRDRSWADPFPLRHGDGWLVFVEEIEHRAPKGRIVALEVRPDGSWSGPVPVLERPYHLSYPFVFRHRGETFMIPETGSRGTVELYRATALPDRWSLEAVLLEGAKAVDATLHRQGERWWMFVNRAEEGAQAHDELHLYAAESPFGPYHPHPANPVVSDTRSARPAGRLFTWRGELYRPAQDCSRRYGWAVSLERVERLDGSGYEERTAAKILPRWRPDLLATHTFNRTAGLTVLDGMRRLPPFGLGRRDG